MAFAPFFDKAALAASHVLQGFDSTAFTEKLSGLTVGIAFDQSAALSQEGTATLELSVNLLSRLYPKITIVELGKECSNLKIELVQLACAINPNIEIISDPAVVDAGLVVGKTRPTDFIRTVYIGSTGWIVQVSGREPVGSGVTQNPFAAGAAACIGAANIFRMLFEESLPAGQPDDSLIFSLLDYQTNASRSNNPAFTAVDIGETHLVGLGAIGNGVVWALTRVKDLQGKLHLIDPENVDRYNPQRYVLATLAHENSSKVSLAAELFKNSNLTVIPQPQRWGEYLVTRNDWNIQRVAVAVDSEIDRFAIQASLPRWILNAWTQPGDLGVSRHDFINNACLMCLYLPTEKQKSMDEIVAEAIGLPKAVREVRELLYTGSPVGTDFVNRIAQAFDVPVEPLLPYADEPLNSFYSGAICGGIVLRLGGDHKNFSKAEVPMAFQSALAGIMLAAEIVIQAGGLRLGSLPTMTKINLLSPLGEYLSVPAAKHPSSVCICQDDDYISVYKKKYSSMV